MKYHDFEYDGIKLSDLGYIICEFDSGGMNTVSNGSKLTFNTIPALNGNKHELVNTKYEENITTTLQICKNPDTADKPEISSDELRYLMTWLNRKEFHKLKLSDMDGSNLYFEASFNISRIEIAGRVCGLELEMITNRPFALADEISISINNTNANGAHIIESLSDDEGYLYPHVEITLAENGNLNIYNAIENRDTYIANCTAGEVITLDYPVIRSSLPSHEIQNDFNWNFFRISRTFAEKSNHLTVSIPCTIKITYSPIVKAGI